MSHLSKALGEFLARHPSLFIQQRKEWVEIVVDFETLNKYAVLDPEKNEVAFIAERGGGFRAVLRRWILRSHRPLEIDVLSRDGEKLLHLSRPFFWFFSDLEVRTPEGEKLGSIHRRWGIIRKKYDLRDETGQVFAKVASPVWRVWTFPISEVNGTRTAAVSKKWGGALREIFTDADTYQVDFGSGDWEERQRAVIFAAAVSIDFDFFENNQGRG